tara:strand:+ start:394 stop:1107 length:714 start_codon:yes stop_codon:yes gene_type:complete
MSLKKIFLKSKITYKIYLYYNLYIRHKGFLSRKMYSQWGEDKFIAEFFKDKKKGVYLDIGCFNPFMYSNTCLLHKKGWSGINIDINPTSIDLFNIARPKDFNICTTISDENKSFEVFLDDPFSPVNTIDKKFYKKLGKSFSTNKISTVGSKSIDEILKLSGINKCIDYINIDVEGSDYKILTEIKISKLNPKLISIETHNTDGSESLNFRNINDYLNKNNFCIFKRIGPTTLYMQKN